MKQYMKFIMTMALLLTTMSVWAEQNVTIVVNPSASAGTVTQKVENGVCTLTVTPASGYYLTAENLTVVTCLDGSGVQSPRRATDIEIKSETLEVTALNATADPSGVTSYTFTMPEDETIGVEVTAEFQTLIAITPTVTLESWTYGEDANTPVVEGNPGNGEVTFTYAVKGSTTFTNAVPATAGDYTVKANVAAAMQYAAGEATADFSISKAATSITKAPTAKTLTYIGELQELVTAGEATGGTMVYSLSQNSQYSESIPEGKNAGTYVVFYTVSVDNNHTATDTLSVQVTIEQATIDAVELEESVLTYNGQTQSVVIASVWAGDLEVSSDYYQVSGNAKKDVGDYELVVSAKTMEGNNFKGSVSKEWSIVNRTLEVNKDVTFVAGQKWASFVSPSEDLLLPEGMMAFIVTEIGASSVTVKAINYVPKDEPVLLEIDTEETTTNSSAAGNLLQAASEATNVSSINGTVYGLYNNSMMRVNTGTIAKGKCYLVVNAQQSAPRLTIEKDGEATGIENITTTLSEGEEVWYSLDGKKLQKPTSKGIYIVKGKKMVIK